MEEKPSRLIAELRAPEHRPSLLAFMVVAIVCSMVVATGIRLETVTSVLNPLPSWLFAIGSDLVDDEPPLRAVQSGSELEPQDEADPVTEESSAPSAPLTSAPAPSEQRDARAPGGAPGPRPGAGDGAGKSGKGQGKGRDGKGGNGAGGAGGPGNSGGAGNGAGNGNGGSGGPGNGSSTGPGSSGAGSNSSAGRGKGHASGRPKAHPGKSNGKRTGAAASHPGKGNGNGNGKGGARRR